MGYRMSDAPGLRPLVVLGSYETPTGGCDTIPEIATVFDTISALAEGGENVLFEGILAQHSAKRFLAVHQRFNSAECPVEIVTLTTPLETAVECVRARRRERGADAENFDPKNVVREHDGVISSSKRLESAGVALYRLDRAAALSHVLSRLAEVPQCAA